MANPDFPLAPWEVLPGSNIPLVAPADVVYRGVLYGPATELWARNIETPRGPRLYVREADSDEVGNWSLPGYTNNGICSLATYLNYQSRCPSRRFNFDGARYGHPGWHELEVNSHHGQWMFEDESANFRVSYRLLEELPKLRAAQIGRLVRSELDYPSSEARYAFEWLHLNLAERQSQSFGVSAEVIGQVQLLMRHILHANNWLWEAPSQHAQSSIEGYSWTLTYPEPEWDYPETECNKDDRSTGLWQFEFMGGVGLATPTNLRSWSALIYRHLLRIPRERVMHALCMQDYSAMRIEVRVSEPTAHEQLESHVFLRQWHTPLESSMLFADLMKQEPLQANWRSLI